MKKTILGIVRGGIAVFMIGILVGNTLKSNALTSIQGYLFKYATATDGNASDANYWDATDGNASDANYWDATDGNASDANYWDATDGNASDANYWSATDGNASDGNASGANVQPINSNDNVINLTSFSLNKTVATVGDTVYVTLKTTGALVIGGSVILRSPSHTTVYGLKINSMFNRPYVVIPKNMIAANYQVTDLLLTGLNSDETTFSKSYASGLGINSSYFKFNCTIKVNNPYEKIKLNSISFDKSKIGVGEKVNVNIDASEELESVKLTFKHSQKAVSLSIYVKNLQDNPYFEIPTNFEKGKYSLTGVALSSANVTTTYTLSGSNQTEKLNFNYTIEVSENSNAEAIYNNEDITAEVISNLYESSNPVITINASGDTIINSEIFNIAKSTNKRLIISNNDNSLIFDGGEINTPKAIDASIAVGKIRLNTTIGGLVPNGIIVSFADNGNLPGKATVKIKANKITDEILGVKDVYVYFFNTSNQKFVSISDNVRKTSDGYYEFEITHNSDYILVNEKLDDLLLYKEGNSSDEVVAFQKSDNLYLLMIGAGLALAIVVAVVIIVLNSKKKNGGQGNIIENVDVTTIPSPNQFIENPNNNQNDINQNNPNDINQNNQQQ